MVEDNPQTPTTHPDGTGLNVSLRPEQMTVITPEEDTRLLVSEDQLDALCKRAKDTSFEISLLFGGAAFGFVQNVVSLIGALSKKEVPGGWDVFASMLCIALAAAGISKFTQFATNKQSLDSLVEKIKSGRRVSVK